MKTRIALACLFSLISIKAIMAAPAITTDQLEMDLTNGTATGSSPTYVEGSHNALSMDLSGNLRVVCVIGCGTGGSGSSNIAQFGGANIVTGVGVSGLAYLE